MKYIVSGGTGFIGKRLVDALLADHHYVSVWSRKPGIEKRPAVGSFYWDPVHGEPAEESINGFDCIVHLAGEPVAQRWTAEVKRKIRDSRVIGTRNLVKAISRAKQRPATLVCASAIGYYGARGDEIVDESSGPGTGFLAEVCQEWEREADRATALGVRVTKIRVGIVLGPEGGALKAMLPAFESYAGGRLGSGKQWMSWIHIDDMVAMFRAAIQNPEAAVWNGTAPNPVTNAQFTADLGTALGKPALLQVPPFALKLLLGEMAQVVLTGVRALPKAPQAAGFVWKFPSLPGALASIELG